jgi:DNA modification methylase
MALENVSNLVVTYQPVTNLTAFAHNARSHSPQQVRQIAACIKEFGFTNPVLVDGQNTIIAGHGRVAAAKLLRMALVPTIRLEGLSEDELRAYVIADNRIAEKAGWDPSILAIELQHLLSLELNFDVTLTGFEVAEIDLIVENARTSQTKEPAEEIITNNQAITQFGDIWRLGRHRILCANSLQAVSFKRLMAGKRANLVFVDPPYNLPIAGYVSGDGVVAHPDFAMASGELTVAEFQEFLRISVGHLANNSAVGSVHFICIDWRHIGDVLAAGKKFYDAPLNLCVWVKNNGGKGSFYRSQHELIFVFRNGKGSHRNNIRFGKYGRNRTNVWDYPCAPSFSKVSEEGNLLHLHPTVKPVALIADAILDCSARGDLVLDSFLGSGSTLMGAERVGRVCYGIEIAPSYVDIAIRRWQRHTGNDAILEATGQTFAAAEALSGRTHVHP